MAKETGKKRVLLLLGLRVRVRVSGEKERERGALNWEGFGHEKRLGTSFCCFC